MSKIGGKVGAKAQAFKMLLDRHSVEVLMNAFNAIDAQKKSNSHYLRRFFYRDNQRMKMKKVDGEFRLVHEQDVVGCLVAVKVNGVVYIGHSRCHDFDNPNKLIGAYVAEMQAGLSMIFAKNDAISAQFKTKDVEDFMARCIKYFRVDNVKAKMWSFDADNKRFVREIDMVRGEVHDTVDKDVPVEA
jgi:hypothetical protein